MRPFRFYADAQDQQMWRAVTSSRVVTLCDVICFYFRDRVTSYFEWNSVHAGPANMQACDVIARFRVRDLV